ncbi:MAG: hypothetical protein Q8L87_03980 [Anaerolineales bacterium]|nr:hypothetical protein [Anaerolineales bacterium]
MNNPSASVLDSARKKLLRWGGVMIFIYLIYLFAFPLTPHIQREGRMLDIEIMLRESGARWFIWVYIVGLLVLFYAFWRMVKTVREISKQNNEAANSLRGTILTIGITCGVILLGLYPITALDVALYVVRARVWTLHGGNPLTALPEAYPQDRYIAIAGEFADETSPYGPLWEIIAQIPMQMGVTDIAGGVLAMKVIALLAFIGMAWLIGWKSKTVSVTALTFFALNPLVLLEAIGNGHNDILMLAFITLGLILWQRGHWLWAMLALTLATMTKITGVIIIPLFGLAVLIEAPNWTERLKRGLGLAAVFCGISLALYGFMGPLPDVFTGTLNAMFSRRSASVPYALHVIVREFNPAAARGILTNSKYLFLLVYGWLAIAMLRKKLTLLEAGFLAYLAQIILSNAFRIWYPLWLIPFATLNLNSKTYWRTFLFSLTAEFSILSYYILWRWYWRGWDWGMNGPLASYWNFWTIMTPFTVSWTFTIPFLGDLILWLKRQKKPDQIPLP